MFNIEERHLYKLFMYKNLSKETYIKVSSPNFVKSRLSKKHFISITVDTLKPTGRSEFLSIRFNFFIIGKE